MIYNTLPVAAQGAADLERPAGGDRRPLAGMFRVRVVPGDCCRDVLQDGIRTCSGTLGVSFGMQTILRGMRGANFIGCVGRISSVFHQKPGGGVSNRTLAMSFQSPLCIQYHISKQMSSTNRPSCNNLLRTP